MAKKQRSLCARSAAALIIAEVQNRGRSLNGVLTEFLPQLNDNDRSFCQQLCYGVLRWQPSLVFLSNQLLKKAFKNKDADIAALLLLGIYQLRDLRTPSHAAISETVNAAKILGKQWATGLLNACLRNYQRQQDELETSLKNDAVAFYAHPEWLLQHYQQDWPEYWQKIMAANNQQAPMMLRVNRLQASRETYMQQLADNGIKASELSLCDQGVLLDSACDVLSLPDFETGRVSVQDGAAQLVAPLMQIAPGQRILDACAAPGGKTCHILEQESANKVLALDISAERLNQIEQNVSRLDLNAELIAADAATSDDWWDGEQFDRILIDAPCSGTGVIRRHPDIKLLRRPEDISALAQSQQRLLDKLWPLLKADGLMVYTTCSAFKQENEQQIEAFLQRHPEAEEVRFERPPATSRPYGYQRLPGDDVMDGFFYACLRRR
ncbi:16S rRNA (cytosine(967)-C(5))-methyltransferase RsmB [Methylophaga sp.]|uniref:16S rRNA (cytosine(967)-C(5))-methyltransferase RsmB n=1 Tax=Methylophaga sp. TaxID=2024840 RepID=UPI003F69C0D3